MGLVLFSKIIFLVICIPGIFAVYLITARVVNMHGVDLERVVVDDLDAQVLGLVASQVERESKILAVVGRVDEAAVAETWRLRWCLLLWLVCQAARAQDRRRLLNTTCLIVIRVV